MVSTQSQNVHKLPQKRISQNTNPLANGFIFHVFCSKNILTKLIGCLQPTCLCVNMELVAGSGTISLSCELYSLSWSCFRSCGSAKLCTENGV